MFDVHQFLLRLIWPLFRPAAGLVWNYIKAKVIFVKFHTRIQTSSSYSYSSFVLDKILIHEDEYEKNQIKSHAFLTPDTLYETTSFITKMYFFWKANRRISNIEPQNYEGWNRYALSFEDIKIDRMPSFDIRYSWFDIRYSLFKIFPKPSSIFRFDWPLFRPEEIKL